MKSESELAFVLGHEVSHIAAKHGAQRLSQQKSIQIANVFASLFMKDNDSSKQLTSLVNQGVQLAVLGYGRDNEFESDLLGARYASEAAYHTDDFDDFFYTLKRQERTNNSWLQTLYSSHPPTTERIERLNNYIASENLSVPPEELRTDENYLKKISGLYMGPGNMIGNIVTANNQILYENVPYQIQFILPPGWGISRSDEPGALIALKHQSMPIQGTLELVSIPSSTASLAKLASGYLRAPNQKIVHKRLSYLQIPAYQTKYRLQFSSFGNAVETATYFKNNGRAYRLVFVSKKTYSTAYDREIESFLKTVSFVGLDRLKKYKAYWIHVHEVSRRQTLQEVLAEYKSSLPMNLTEVAHLNNVSTKQQFTKGQWVKVPVLFPNL